MRERLFVSEPGLGRERFEKADDSPGQIEAGAPGCATLYEADMSALLGNLKRYRFGQCAGLRYDGWRHERIVQRVDNQGWTFNPAQKLCCTASIVVILHTIETVQRCSDGIAGSRKPTRPLFPPTPRSLPRSATAPRLAAARQTGTLPEHPRQGVQNQVPG